MVHKHPTGFIDRDLPPTHEERRLADDVPTIPLWMRITEAAIGPLALAAVALTLLWLAQ